MNSVVFAYRKQALPEGGLLTGKPQLFDKIRERGVTPLVSLEAEAAFNPTGLEVQELIGETTVRSIGHIALDQVNHIVNRLDRSFKMDQMPSTWQEAMPPVSNENQMRSLVFRKNRVQSEILDPLDLGMPTRLIENYLDIDAFMHDHPAATYFAKPNSGTFSKGVQRLQTNEVGNYFSQPDKFGKVILQPAYDFTAPLPPGLRPYDAASEEAFRGWSVADVPKELRMYAFHSPEATTVFPVGRAMKDGEDNWFFVDPESVPDKLVEDTTRVIQSAAEKTGSRAVYAALDMAYGSVGDAGKDYHIVELNGRMPYLIGYDKHEGVADTLRDYYADQIQQTTQGKGGKIK